MIILKEFAVMNINEIKFFSSFFDMLIILTEKKKIVMSLTKNHIDLIEKKKIVMSFSKKNAENILFINEFEKVSEKSCISSANKVYFKNIIIKKNEKSSFSCSTISIFFLSIQI